jgi:sterol desaturase/sphingolipid hydroxylase (fatty acid hydroxylase superfamily)
MSGDVDLGNETERWNFHPGEAVQNNPLFLWPPQPKAVLRWYSAYWLVISSTSLSFVVAAMAVWLWTPTVSETTVPGIGWISTIWLGFLIPHTALAGGLHLWLYRAKGQGIERKYDARGQISNNGTFTFRSQVPDNMLWSLVSGITFATVYTILWFQGAANGYGATATFDTHPVWFIAFFAILPLWGSFHFYWVHRWLHWPPLYKIAHALHHRNVNVGPWSGISMHPIEHAIYFSSLLIHFVLPTHPMHILFHVYTFTLSPICSHSGFDGLIAKGDKRVQLGDFFHQLHHRYFECNYGTVEMPWDRWFGTFHDGSEAATKRTRAFKKQMYTK